MPITFQELPVDIQNKYESVCTAFPSAELSQQDFQVIQDLFVVVQFLMTNAVLTLDV